ncbi:MAG: HEPN domain-containing protein [Cyanobacteria bacterium]|nr:HEPN domain-containing protein [Cyanobacteriota bacterium]
MGKASINWLKIAKYDLGAAENALDGGYYIKVFEHAHSALEKLLKGIIAENNQEPQKIHDLLRLASEALIKICSLKLKL